MSLLEKMSWRYATKKFDPTKKIPSDKLEELLSIIRLSPSSYGLQHYKVIVVENAETKAKLVSAAYGQAQLAEASQVLVFAAETNINDAYVQRYADEIVKTRNTTPESIAGYKDMMLNSVNGLAEEQKLIWAQKQAYIALGVLVSAAAELDIDVCPMEGFNAAQFDEILGLKEKGLTASVIAPIGYRASDDTYAQLPKVRKPADEFFIHA